MPRHRPGPRRAPRRPDRRIRIGSLLARPGSANPLGAPNRPSNPARASGPSPSWECPAATTASSASRRALGGPCSESPASRPGSSVSSESSKGSHPASAVRRLLTTVAHGCATGARCRLALARTTRSPVFEASYSDVHAAISADLDVSSRLAFTTTERMSLSLPIRNRWKSRAPAGVSRSDRVCTAASVSRCNAA